MPSGIYKRTKKTRKILSEAHKGKTGYWLGKHRSIETKEKIRKANKGHKPWNTGISFSKKSIKKMSDTRLKKWQDLEYQKMMAKAQHLRPNNLEQFFNKLTPEYVKYVGDFSLWIKTKKGSRNPDFIIVGKNKVIELFGNYYHKGENPKDKIEEYAKVGFNCIIFWENEIYNETNRILEETLEFVKNCNEKEE